MKKYYDVVIVGASIAGMEAARQLSKSKLQILVIERSKEIGTKICAHGVTTNDLEFIPSKLLNFSLKKLLIHYKNRTITFPNDSNVITSIDRQEFLQYRYSELRKYQNIDFLFGSTSKITSNNSILLNGKKIEFKYLIGADGSSSSVRRHLKIDSQKMGFGVQYLVPKIYDNFELFFDSKLFGTGCAWIYPNKKFTSIGCGSDINVLPIKKIKENLGLWLQRMNIDVSDGKFQAALLNYDYQGYKFGNIYLSGDAAGLVPPITGKGMLPAFISAKQIANEILGKKTGPNLIQDYLKKKNSQEKYLNLLKKNSSRKIFLYIGIHKIFFSLFKQKILANL